MTGRVDFEFKLYPSSKGYGARFVYWIVGQCRVFKVHEDMTLIQLVVFFSFLLGGNTKEHAGAVLAYLYYACDSASKSCLKVLVKED